MNYGFVIDNRKCIGCHACSTACKSENEVPLGVQRTWVKYVETGAYPNVTRHFQVTRCNHCANPPCVRICPVTAMFQRGDGIVEFDSAACIGCKACMQACPYDAIYIDPDSHTAAKCHYCAHRVEIGLEPACVVVCPEHAILAGDLDDPDSEISRHLAAEQVTVRKPEQGTAPKLFYIHGNDVALHPTATERAPATYLWSDVIPLHAGPRPQKNSFQNVYNYTQGPHSASTAIAALSAPAATGSDVGSPWVDAGRVPPVHAQGLGAAGTTGAGPIHIGRGRMADHLVQVAYNAQHIVPWHWPVPAYLVTKAIGSGLFLLLALGVTLEFVLRPLESVVIGLVALLLIAATAGLLVYDLERPDRFLYILRRPQWRSWLTRGAFILLGLSLVGGIWWLLEVAAWAGWMASVPLRLALLWLAAPLAAGTAIYTAFLFGQAEGRDLWQSSLLPFHLFLQAVMVGAGALLVLDLFLGLDPSWRQAARLALAVTLVLDLGVTLLGEFGMPHASEAAAQAAHAIRHGVYRRTFWGGSILLGHLVPLLLIWPGWALLDALAGLATIAGLYAFEYAFVLAPQEVPNS